MMAWLQFILVIYCNTSKKERRIRYVDLLTTSGMTWRKVGRKRSCQNVKKEVQTKVLDPTMNKISVK